MKKLGINFILILSILIMPFSFSACSENGQTNITGSEENSNNAEIIIDDKEDESSFKMSDVNVGILKGPTGLGMLWLMQQEEDENTYNIYHFTLANSPDVIVAKLLNGEIDVAALPTNTAAALYNKNEGNIRIGAINTMGMLYILENGNTINSINDLKGKTIYATGKGAVPQYVLEYILNKNSINDANIEYKSEHAELSSLMVSGDATLGMLPEPYVTNSAMNNTNLRIAIDLTKEWNAITNNSSLPMGCIVTTAEYADKHPRVFTHFLEEYKSSAEYVSQNVIEAANLAEKFEVMPSIVAQKAIPNCNIVYIDGQEMNKSLNNFYSILYEANPDSIGGAIPNDDIYYEAKN